jgi:uncharacterized membrane protein YdbT with pleckstrin-like domain
VKSERTSFATTALDEAGIPLFAASMLEPSEIIVGVWRPSLAWIALRSARGVSVLVVITLLAAATAGWAQQSWEWLVLQVGAVLICARLGAAGAEWASRVYVLTDRRVLRRRGVLAPTVYSANLNALQRVELLQTRIDRALRSGTITFSSRHEGHYDAAWVMVSNAAEVLALIEETRRRYRR